MWTLELPNWPFQKSTAYDAVVLFLLSSTFQARRKLLTSAQMMVNQKILHFCAGPAAGPWSCSKLQSTAGQAGTLPRPLGSQGKGSSTSSEPAASPDPHLVTAVKTDPDSRTQHSAGVREREAGKGDFFQMRNQQQFRTGYWAWPPLPHHCLSAAQPWKTWLWILGPEYFISQCPNAVEQSECGLWEYTWDFWQWLSVGCFGMSLRNTVHNKEYKN